MTTGTLGFIGSFIFLEDKDKLIVGLVISAIIVLVGYGFYRKITKKLDSIIKEIENL